MDTLFTYLILKVLMLCSGFCRIDQSSRPLKESKQTHNDKTSIFVRKLVDMDEPTNSKSNRYLQHSQRKRARHRALRRGNPQPSYRRIRSS